MYSNRVTLIGFLGKDPEVHNTRNQAPFTVLSLATKRGWKDRESGEYKSQTTWDRCVFSAKLPNTQRNQPKTRTFRSNASFIPVSTPLRRSGFIRT